MIDINRLLASLKRRSSHIKEFGDDITFVKLEDLDALIEALDRKEEQRANWFHMAQKLGEDLDAAEKRNTELDSSSIAPGILRCTECSFVQTKNIISITPDAIVIGNSKPGPCPNGCGPLQPATWKALAIKLMFTTKQGVSELLEANKRISELESFRTAYMEWSDKTDWVQGDKRFDVLIPWGKHRADVLKAYIEYLELRFAELEREKVALESVAMAMRDDMRESRTVTAESFTCPRCGRTTTHPEGWHYCHKREAD
ncbi:MAG: hypothetical protein E6Y01_08440 [Klebsiella aerogenes]|uniref:hypothetical protein n=1 Tax=Klebsiella aerogenes TaxID=548 RepID=UPI0018C24246|nr:hypothetical protein [Klebsiella aerogenes]MBF9784131.1 hypothetical protein [Klebsiella aerogenes]MBF9796464.1 hypothetical protein [Klebsiella aerogenes]MDU4717631.1 hypothetical protein [Klebsiella aerogenes]HBR6843333.1 hypothetical protein [Klebsiella aerogenes]